jgi:hypothetical protein
MRGSVPWLVRVAASALLLLSLVAPAPAQEPKQFQEPDISYKTQREPYLEWTFGVLIVIACLIGAFKNPHRTHD